MTSPAIERLVGHLGKLPGLGPRSARRAALHLLERRDSHLEPLLAALRSAAESVRACAVCGNLDAQDPCAICADPERDRSAICVVEQVAAIAGLVARAEAPEVSEIILATSATVDGQTTAHYLTDRLAACDVAVSRLAHGLPVGGELDYLDDGTLGTALKARQRLL